MDDQTDEDFFDKLVDDDYGSASNFDSPQKFAAEVNDIDGFELVSNLSVHDSGDGEGEPQEQKEGDGFVDGDGSSSPGLKDSKESDSSALLACGSIEQSNDDGIRSNVVSGRAISEGRGSKKPEIKMVDWNSYFVNSIPNDNHGGGSSFDFFNDLGNNSKGFPPDLNVSNIAANSVPKNDESHNAANGFGVEVNAPVNHGQYQDGAQTYGGSMEASANTQDFNSQYWESMYPGWKYDQNTGQWYQIDGYDATATISSGTNEVNFLQQTSMDTVRTMVETNTAKSVSNWNNGYPEHMVFDPQYPGWYYDTNLQQWFLLMSYNPSVQPAELQSHYSQTQDGSACDGQYSQNSSTLRGEYGQRENYATEAYTSRGQHGSYNQDGLNKWHPDLHSKVDTVPNLGGNQLWQNSQELHSAINNHVNMQDVLSSLKRVPSCDTMMQGQVRDKVPVRSQSFVARTNFNQQFNQGNVKQNEQMSYANDYIGHQQTTSVNHQSFQTNQQVSYGPGMGFSPAGRPPHALVTFGFGGKLIVMKVSSSFGSSSFESQGSVEHSISVLNLMDVVLESMNNSSGTERGPWNYFFALCQQAFPGPLVGGNVGNKELNKWIDERIIKCESTYENYKKAEVVRLLLSLLKIACQHYGKLRSPFGADNSQRESDTPETAVAELFASASKSSKRCSESDDLRHCLHPMPSEGQLRDTASLVQNLLVSGRKKEALRCAQEGQLWGPALILASQFGDKYYIDTVKRMALRQLVPGAPLRTLCLLIAGQPADVFCAQSMIDGDPSSFASMSQQPRQDGANCMLEDWEENLAVVTANRTKDDELVITHLGDCLWKERSEITAAHICYLVAEANFEAYSDSARLCLVGADHWKHPRTYASPEAIQQTELYEYSKVLGNSQFILLPFQPYKLIYAYMLAEVGKISDSLKYCQAMLKSLKTGRAPEIETWKQLVLSHEERIRTHQQGGYAANLAPGNLVGKLLNFFDTTAYRVVGGLPPPVPTASHGSVQGMAPRVSSSQSTMAMSSLMPSASMEPISELAADGNKVTRHNRSISEPDFGRSSRQVYSSKEGTSSDEHGKASASTVSSRFGRFGFGSQLLQKTVGLLRPRSDRQAKLGEKNKFYYDEKLKRWVEEGAEPPAEEAALPPPPTTAAFQNGKSDYNLKSALKGDASPSNLSPRFKGPVSSEQTSGMPTIPTSPNQFSARGRMGVRARYVDTFNQGVGASSARTFQPPSVASSKPVAANAKFFVPTPTSSCENLMESIAENSQEDFPPPENPSKPTIGRFRSRTPLHIPLPSTTMLRWSSLNDIAKTGMTSPNGYGSVSAMTSPSGHWSAMTSPSSQGYSQSPSHFRRASWSGTGFPDLLSPPGIMENKPRYDLFSPPGILENKPQVLGEVLGFSSPLMASPKDNELQEVKL